MGCFLKRQTRYTTKKMWVEKGSDFYNRSMKSWLQDNNMEMYSKHNEGNYVVAERFIRTLKNKIYKYMTSISKNLYIDKFADIVNEYNHTYFRTSKMKSFDVKSSTYIDFDKENSKVDPKLEIVDHVRISKYENIFAKGYDPNWSEKFLWLKRLKSD